jgi:hypothetical protein
MRNLFLHMMVSLDGFIEGPNKELNWFVDDDEMLNIFTNCWILWTPCCMDACLIN